MWCGWSYRLTGRWDRQRHTERCCLFICCLPALSSHCTSNTLNLLLRRYTPGLLLAEVYLELRRGCVCVLMKKNISWNLICVFVFFFFFFCSSHLHFCAYFCTCMWKYKCFRPRWIFPLHVYWSHSCCRKLFKQLACNVVPLCMCVCLCVLPMFDYCIYGVVSVWASALC